MCTGWSVTKVVTVDLYDFPFKLGISLEGGVRVLVDLLSSAEARDSSTPESWGGDKACCVGVDGISRFSSCTIMSGCNC